MKNEALLDTATPSAKTDSQSAKSKLDHVAILQLINKSPSAARCMLAVLKKLLREPARPIYNDEVVYPGLPYNDCNCIGIAWRNLGPAHLGLITKTGRCRGSKRKISNGRVIWEWELVQVAQARALAKLIGGQNLDRQPELPLLDAVPSAAAR